MATRGFHGRHRENGGPEERRSEGARVTERKGASVGLIGLACALVIVSCAPRFKETATQPGLQTPTSQATGTLQTSPGATARSSTTTSVIRGTKGSVVTGSVVK